MTTKGQATTEAPTTTSRHLPAAVALRHIAPLPALFSGVVAGELFAIFYQGMGLHDVFTVAPSSFNIDTGVAEIDKLLKASGMGFQQYRLGNVQLCSVVDTKLALGEANSGSTRKLRPFACAVCESPPCSKPPRHLNRHRNRPAKPRLKESVVAVADDH